MEIYPGLKVGCSSETATTASLDRIDSSFGYILNNVQWVHKDVQRMKSDFSEAHFVETCRKITENQAKAMRHVAFLD